MINFYKNLEPEFVISATRSSGPGGQNVNKVSTKAELRFNVRNSQILSEEEKSLIIEKIENKLTEEGWLIVSSQVSRSFDTNKNECISKFYKIIQNALFRPKKRKKTLPSKQWHQERLDEKKHISDIKENRKKIL